MSNLAHALRGLVRTPSFTLITVLILALGVGANTAIFSVVDAAMLKPMPIPEPARIVRLTHGHPQSFVWFNPRGFEVWPAFANVRSFDAVGAYVTGELTLPGYNRGRLRAAAVTPEIFHVLKVAPQIGRAFTANDVLAESFHLAVINHELWQAHFDGDVDVLGRSIVLNQQTFVVLGVMPRGFGIPEATQVWVPSRWGMQVRGGNLIFPIVIGRMAPGMTRSEVVQEIARTSGPLSRATFKDPSQITLTSFRETLVGNLGSVIFLLGAGALIVLIVASTNIASLLLTRVSSRGREFAVRRALGAGDGEIARQVLAEALLLAAMGFVATIPIAAWTLEVVRAWVPIRMYGAGDVAIDARAIGAAAILCLATAATFSAVPIWSSRRRSAVDALRSAAAATSGSRWRRFRSGLAIAEISVALVLLTGAVTVVRTVASLMSIDIGVRADRVLVVGVDMPGAEGRADLRMPFLRRYEEAFRGLPGVETVAITTGVPWTAQTRRAELIIEGLPIPEKAGYVGRYVMSSPEYFSVMGIDLLAGRIFAPADHFYAQKVAIISETFARRYGLRPDQVVGRQVVLDHRWVEIVGVVRDVRTDGPVASLDATAYVPFAQRQDSGPLQFVIKSHGDPAQLIAAARAAGAQVDPNVPLYDIRTFDQIRETHVRDRRFVMTMLSWFGGLAFVLALLGLYAVISYLVHLRTREIGIRIAMGATTGAVRTSVLANGVAHCFAGVVLGGLLALGASQILSSRVRDFGDLDFVTLSSVSSAFLVAAAIAAWIPARRATRIDPVQALRFE